VVLPLHPGKADPFLDRRLTVGGPQGSPERLPRRTVDMDNLRWWLLLIAAVMFSMSG
jgi:hypothetical protein